MAKKEKHEKPEVQPSKAAMAQAALISTAADANATLRHIGWLENRIAATVAHEREKILAAQKRLADDTAQDLADIGALEKALEAFAFEHKGELFTAEKRSIKLSCGDLGLKWEKPHLEYLIAEETVVNRMEAAELPSELLHIEKTPNLKLLIDYDADFLKPFGLAKKQDEKFWYKVKPEVK